MPAVDSEVHCAGQSAAWPWFALGAVLTALLLGLLAEGFLRLSPPRDLEPYLGDSSSLAGIYKADPDFGVSYRSWDDFRHENGQRLDALAPLTQQSDSGTWAFFGNSFVQAPGMLADHARQSLPDRPIFNLGRNEPVYLRLTQIKLLLESGWRPERIFVVLMPVDLLGLGEQPLATLRVTPRGAVAYQPRPPPAGEWLIGHSRLALAAWCRTGRQKGNPRFNKRTLYEQIDPLLLADLQTLFGNLARVTARRRVPVSVVLIPAWHQVTQGASLGFQDTLAPLLARQGFDVLDLREPFCSHPARHEMFLPDKHFNHLGNQVLLAALTEHVERGHGGRPAEPEYEPPGPALAEREATRPR